jgi:chromosome segregation ATPase
MSNMPALYEISRDYQQALAAFADPDSDLPPEAVADTLEGIEGQLQEKAVNIAKFMQNLDAAADAIKEAERRMAVRRKAIEHRAQWLKDYLKRNMEATGITRIDSPWFNLSVQNNPVAVEILDEAALPEAYKTEVVTIKIDKTAIKQALKAGDEVPGAMLTQGTRLAIR